MTGQLGKKYLKDYIESTKELFDDYAKRKIKEAYEIGDFPGEITEIFFKMAARGKRIRGSLVTLGYRAAGGKDRGSILNASLFFELFHAGLLVHDDVQDKNDKRRGLVSLHKQYADEGKKLGVEDPEFFGRSIAILPGDLAFYLSWEMLLGENFPAERIVKAGLVYADYTQRLAHGQALDIVNVETQNITEKDVLSVLRHKSADYTGTLPLLVGATLGGMVDEKKLIPLKTYGLSFGWAFQIQDDILDLYADEKKFGKPIGGDLKEGKNTLLMLHLAQNGTKKQKEFQKRVLGNRDVTKEDVKKMKQVLKDSGSYDYVVDLGWKHVEEGKKYISDITNDKKMRDILESLIVYMMERVK